ncbi:hypothetical protein F5Y11DRAFT_349220 [Daldinia sp. FL1419]|nr:hypothetical protein F5Y11DRAFT_349220 [Daldinia sp. FL1419]
MCPSTYCTSPRFGTTLEYDDYGGTGSRKGAVGRERTKTAGCTPHPNRYSRKPRKNCDEYPFASTSDADKGGRVLKCVSETHNSRQGAIISHYVQKYCESKKCKFTIGFGNPTARGVKYNRANKNPRKYCVSDHTVFKNGRADKGIRGKRDLETNSTMPLPGCLYLMNSSVTVAFGEDLEIGTRTKRAAPRNTTFIERVVDGLEDGEDD